MNEMMKRHIVFVVILGLLVVVGLAAGRLNAGREAFGETGGTAIEDGPESQDPPVENGMPVPGAGDVEESVVGSGMAVPGHESVEEMIVNEMPVPGVDDVKEMIVDEE